VHGLDLLRGGHLSGADGPDGFVRDDDLRAPGRVLAVVDLVCDGSGV
jgi:hypothetical protein